MYRVYVTVDLHLNKLFIIIAVPYLSAVANFFIQGMPQVENTQKAAVKESRDVICKFVSVCH